MDDTLLSSAATFDDVRILLYQPKQVFREIMRATLQGVGFRSFVNAETLNQVEAEFRAPKTHLAVLHAEAPDEVIGAVRDLRHGEYTGDPFLPVVATCSHVTDIMARAAVDAGVDQLWRLPVRASHVSVGITTLVERRQPFVVTTDYMGPDRRKTARPGRQIPRIDVPNALRMTLYDEDPKAPIDQFRRLFDRLRVERQVEQVGWLLDRLAPLKGEDQPADNTEAWLDRLEVVADDMVARIRRTRHRPNEAVCRRLRGTAVNLRQEPSASLVEEAEDIHKELERVIQPVIGAESAAVD